MKLIKSITAAALAGTLILAGCGSDAASNTSSSSPSAQETDAENVSSSSSEDTAEAQDKEEEIASSEMVTGEDYSEDLLPVFSGDYTYSEVMKLGNYKGIELTEEIKPVTDEDVDEYIKSMAEYEEVTDPDAKALLGDTVNIAYVGTKDGVAFDGGTSDSYDLVLGSGSFIDGFEDGVVGMKVGEERDLDLTFPENYHAADLAGADVVFHVTLNAIKRAPEITDEWVRENYKEEFEDADDLREYTRSSLEENNRTAAHSDLRQQAWSVVFDNTEYYKLPEELIEEGEQQYEAQYKSAAEQYGMTLEEYLEAVGLSEENLEKEKKQYAQSVAKNVLLMNAIWDAEKMTEDEEYNKIIEDLASSYGLSTKDFLAEKDAAAVEQYARTQKILNFIVDNAKITEKSGS